MNDKCKWKYSKGPNKGKVCNKKCDGPYCSKHIINKTQTIDVKENDSDMEIESLISVIDNVSVISKTSYRKTDSTQDYDNDNCNDDLYLSKYYVYDCIRQFLKEHNEIQNILHPQSKSSGSNMSNIMMMVAMGVAPILIRNLII